MDERVDADPVGLAGALDELSRHYRSEIARIEQEIRAAVEEVYRKYEHS